MEYVKVLVAGILVSWILSAECHNVKDLLPCKFPAIYNFGDSNSDTGSISAAFFARPPPNGETFFHMPVGRVSDGRLIIDFIAERLGLPYLSPYLDSLGTSFRHGANFATGGSTIRRWNESMYVSGVSPFSVDIQVAEFDQFKSRTARLYRQARNECDRKRLPRPEDFSKALYTIDIGQNDLAAAFRNKSMTTDQVRESIPDILTMLVISIQTLHQLGARTFWIHNTGPLGCLPYILTNITGSPPGFFDKNGCIKVQNDVAMEFNMQLKNKVIDLREQFADAEFTYVDVFAVKYGLIDRAKEQGFVSPNKICCGLDVNGLHVGCGQILNISNTVLYGASCADPSSYISWDGVHYTEAANRWIANHLLDGSWSDPPVPVIQACRRHV